MLKPRIPKSVLACAFLLAEVLVFYRQVIFSSRWGIPWDFRSFHLPLATFIANSLSRGELPLWDPYTYCGFPFFANIQAQLFYPPTLVTILISNLTGGTHLADLLEWQIVLHVWLAGVFAYWLLRRLNVSRMAALVGATVFQLGGYFASQAQHLGAMDGAAWLPLAWLSVLSLGRGFSWRWAGALSAALAMSILAGFPAVSFVVVASSFLLALVLVAFRYAPLRLAVSVILACVWSLLLAALQVAPTAELTRLSVARYRSDFMGTGGGVPLASLVSLVMPNYYGIFDLSKYSSPWQPTFLYIYCGMAGLAFVLASLVYRKSAYVKPFMLMTVLSLLWMLGDSTPAGKWGFPLLPGILRSAIYPESAMAAFMLAAGVLAGLCAHRFFLSKPPFIGACIVLASALDLILVGSGRPMNTSLLYQGAKTGYTEYEEKPEVLERVRALIRHNQPPDRIDTVNDSMDWAMSASLRKIPMANGNDPLALIRLMQVRLSFTGGKRWGRYYQVTNPDSPVLDLLNVRLLLSRTPLESAAWTKAAEFPGRQVYENHKVLPRFYLVDRAVSVRNMEEGLAVMRKPGFNPRALAVVEGPADFTAAPGGEVHVVEYKPQQVVLEVSSPTPAFLVTSETYYPGWRAFVDGRQHPILVTNVAFRGLPVPAGRHLVEMRFEPRILWYSLGASLLGWALLAWAMMTRRTEVLQK